MFQRSGGEELRQQRKLGEKLRGALHDGSETFLNGGISCGAFERCGEQIERVAEDGGKGDGEGLVDLGWNLREERPENRPPTK